MNERDTFKLEQLTDAMESLDGKPEEQGAMKFILEEALASLIKDVEEMDAVMSEAIREDYAQMGAVFDPALDAAINKQIEQFNAIKAKSLELIVDYKKTLHEDFGVVFDD